MSNRGKGNLQLCNICGNDMTKRREVAELTDALEWDIECPKCGADYYYVAEGHWEETETTKKMIEFVRGLIDRGME